MSESLVLFSIGPVRRFIETARKTEDLWMGSYILSYLNGVAMKTLTADFSKQDIEIIFPSVNQQPLVQLFQGKPHDKSLLTLPTLPNRFLARGTCLKSDMENVEKVVREKFQKLAEESLNNAFGEKWRDTYAQQIVERQIRNFLEIYWVIHPIKESSYKETYINLEKELGGVKNCRWFKQIPEESRKCSLCGERE